MPRTAQFYWQVSSIVFLGAYTASLFFVHRTASGYTTLWDGWVGNIVSTLPLVPVLLRVRASTRLRWAWLAMGVGIALNSFANLLYLLHDQNLNPIPSPAPSDVPYLLSMLAFIVGVAMMTQNSYGKGHFSVRLDGAVAGLALGAVAVALWFGSVLQVSGNALQVATGLAYPVADLVLLVLLVAGLAPQHYRPTWSTGLLMGGVAAFVFGDIVYLNQTAAGTYVGGTPLEATWCLGIVLMGIAAWAPDARRLSERQERRRRPRETQTVSSTGIGVVPVVFGVVSLAVLVYALFARTSTLAPALAIGALAFVIVRMALTLREVRQAAENFRDARTDVLTGTKNRRAFLEQLRTDLDGRSASNQVGVLLIDLDGFKEVNDSLGHHNGDGLLKIIANRFAGRLETPGSLARLGGDEFAIACPVPSREELLLIAHRVAAALDDPISLEGVHVRIGARPASLLPDDGETDHDLLRTADVAMYEAKRTQSVVCSYHAEYDLNSRDRLMLITDLREAIEKRALTLHYQPTLEMRTASVQGVEALVRWQHPTRGLMYPDSFIPLAERVGLLPQLTRAVLQLAIAEAARLHARGYPLHMSVNISRYDLIDEHLPEYIDELLEQHGVRHERLTLEVTESCLGEEPERVRRHIQALRARGIRISIDDFGVGYSSMSQLLELPIDELKIDKSFVLALEHDHRAQAIIRSTIELGRALSLTITAEGTECADTLNSLRLLGTDIAQGYHIARPLTPDQLYSYLEEPARDYGFLPAPVLAPAADVAPPDVAVVGSATAGATG